jgi:PEP-CTERM motif
VILTNAISGHSAELVIQRPSGAVKSGGFAAHPEAGVSAELGVTLEETPTAAVPEPDTLALVGTVVAVIALITLLRKRRRK